MIDVHLEQRVAELDARAALAADRRLQGDRVDDAGLEQHAPEAEALAERAGQRALEAERAFAHRQADRALAHQDLAQRLAAALLLQQRAQQLLFGHRRRAEQDVAQARAQEQDHVLGRGLVQARLQGEHRIELGLFDQAELDQQRAELAVVRGLPGERGVEARARQQAGAGRAARRGGSRAVSCGCVSPKRRDDRRRRAGGSRNCAAVPREIMSSG